MTDIDRRTLPDRGSRDGDSAVCRTRCGCCCPGRRLTSESALDRPTPPFRAAAAWIAEVKGRPLLERREHAVVAGRVD